MDREKLHAELARLHDELQRIDAVDAADREMLARVMGDIRALLDAPERERSRLYSGLAGMLREGIDRLEAAHPRATQLMGEVANTLAGIGL
jgi:hypothetical protein